MCERIIEFKKIKAVKSQAVSYHHKTAQVGLNGFTDFLDMTFKIQLIVYNYSEILHFRYLFNKFPINFYIQKLC